MKTKSILHSFLKKKPTPSRLVMTLLTRDSADVLRENIDFHLSQGVDFIIAMDNLSTDGTKEILESYQERGVLHYIYQPSTEFNQAKWVTQMARMAKKRFGATWVINNDCDEFWWPTDTSKNLKTIFSELDASVKVAICSRKNFIYPIESDSNSSFIDTMIYKDVKSLNSVDEVLPSKVVHRGYRRVKVGAGNHSVSGIGRITKHEAGIEIFHFPFRSKEQLIQKVRITGKALESSEIQKNTYTTWQKLFQELQDTDNVDDFVSEYSYTQEQISQCLKSGKLVEDTRLKEYLSRLEKKSF